MTEISVVVPEFNEAANIELFIAAVTPILQAIDPRWEILFVNDGSRDATLDVIRAANFRELPRTSASRASARSISRATSIRRSRSVPGLTPPSAWRSCRSASTCRIRPN